MGGKLKEELLKSVAQPMMIFYAPFGLFVMNAVCCPLLLILGLIMNSTFFMIFSVLLFIILHFVAVIIGKKEPHIDNILASRNNIRTRTKNVLVEKGNKFMT